MSYRFLPISDSIKTLNTPIKYSIACILVFASCQTYATPADFGDFTLDNSPKGIASGSYKTLTGATGTYIISAGDSKGYSGRTIEVGDNGVEIKNNSNSGNDRDKFTYTITITPDDRTSIHTIVIGQASYATEGNSELARQTLSFTESTQINIPVQATVRENTEVDYFFGAMGDYFMGKKLAGNSFSSNNKIIRPQLRVDSSSDKNNLYYYSLTALNGTGNSSSFTPTTNANGQVSFASGRKRGILPPTPTFKNILKESSTNPNNQTSYSALNTSTVIPNNGSYVSYGVENVTSNYVIAVRNAESVTLTYEGIMQGNSALEADVVGETYNEWISFGVESVAVNYIFSGTVFNDNGGIDDQFAKDNPDTIGGIYNNEQYFNGTFDSNESGIAGSTVSLASNCNSPNPNIIATQTITAANGKYNFKVPISSINPTNSICIIEGNNTDYPIRTMSAKNPISFIDNKYLYQDINFGRVIAANKALVLEKEQAVNDCSITTLLPSAQNNLSYSKIELRDVDPGQCIAYRITATNRANLAISNFVMRDKLQVAGEKNATVTSILVEPRFNATDYASDSIAIGENGPVITNSFSIAPTMQKVFYFNTKYGDSQSPP
ncbi:hypothetical protein ACS8FD_07980 [Psychrobacter sp. 1U2]|uniref:hypothetical protein n=1 Tax=Psychrobacter sp. 1U2 TaxID=3453577 RepID=UPI003F4564E5